MKTQPRFAAPAIGPARILAPPAPTPHGLFDHPDIEREFEKTGLRLEVFAFGAPKR